MSKSGVCKADLWSSCSTNSKDFIYISLISRCQRIKDTYRGLFILVQGKYSCRPNPTHFTYNSFILFCEFNSWFCFSRISFSNIWPEFRKKPCKKYSHSCGFVSCYNQGMGPFFAQVLPSTRRKLQVYWCMEIFLHRMSCYNGINPLQWLENRRHKKLGVFLLSAKRIPKSKALLMWHKKLSAKQCAALMVCFLKRLHTLLTEKLCVWIFEASLRTSQC